MNWIDIKEFETNQGSSEDKYLVMVHDKDFKCCGYEFAELIRDYLVIDSVAMNHYGPGYFYSHYLKIENPFITEIW